jgi:hypothetical protein
MKTKSGFRDRFKESWQEQFPDGVRAEMKKDSPRQAALKKKIAEREKELQAEKEARKNAPKNKWEIRAEKIKKTGDNIQDASDKVSNAGAWMTRKITIPVVLFFVGLITLPFGLIIWLIAILFYASRYK